MSRSTKGVSGGSFGTGGGDCSPGGATESSQGWSAAEPLESATPIPLGLSPGGATESCAPPGLDSSRNAGQVQGFRFASPLATIGRPSGAAEPETTSADPDRPVMNAARSKTPHTTSRTSPLYAAGPGPGGADPPPPAGFATSGGMSTLCESNFASAGVVPSPGGSIAFPSLSKYTLIGSRLGGRESSSFCHASMKSALLTGG